MSARSTGLLAAILAFGATSALASGVSVTPGTLDPSFNFGHFSILATYFDGVSDVTNTAAHTYGAPTSNAEGVSSGDATATGSLVMSNSPTPGIQSSATLLGGPSGRGATSAAINTVINYSFQIIGAPGIAQVRIDAVGAIGFTSLATTQGSSGNIQEVFEVATQFNGPVIIDEELGLSNSEGILVNGAFPHDVTTTPSLGFSIGGFYTLSTNTVYDVLLRTNISGAANGATPESLFANIDPTFTVDGPFTLQVSPGFGGVALGDSGGVPEPATWAIMLVGFAAIGALARDKAGSRATAGS